MQPIWQSTVHGRSMLMRLSHVVYGHVAAAGIVQGQAAVVDVEERENFRSIRIEFPAGKVDGVQIGASVAVNGTCLTV